MKRKMYGFPYTANYLNTTAHVIIILSRINNIFGYHKIGSEYLRPSETFFGDIINVSRSVIFFVSISTILYSTEVEKIVDEEDNTRCEL
jgi:hypothetical protein